MSVSAVVEVTTAVLISEDPPGAVTLTTIVTSAKPGAGWAQGGHNGAVGADGGPAQLPWLTVHDLEGRSHRQRVDDRHTRGGSGPALVDAQRVGQGAARGDGAGEAFLPRARSAETPG
jgi:hypothetical protein